MTRCLVMSDAHLKADLIDCIEQLWESGVADKIVSLGDWLDDWGAIPSEYDAFKERFTEFVKKHKKHLVLLWGNHDYGYMCKPYQCSGFDTENWVEHKAWLWQLDRICPISLVYREGLVLFSHAGIAKGTHAHYTQQKVEEDFEPWLNSQFSNTNFLWQNDSPIWHRPHNNYHKNTFDPSILQVVGHTPVMEIKHAPEENVLYTDTWSTDSYRRPIGNQKVVAVDTNNQTWEEF